MSHSPVRYLVLWLTTACNLHCSYCYRKDENSSTMSEDVARTALSLASTSGLPFHVQLAGGEPTLEPQLIEFIGRTVRKAGWPATIALQSNGTLVDRHLIDLCLRYDISIGVSLDGPPDVQEELRGMSGATFRGLSMLEKAEMPVRTTAVLSSVNAGRFRDLALVLARFRNIRGVGLDPIVMTGRAKKKPDLFPAPETVRSGVQALFDAMEWIRRDHGRRIDWRERSAVRQALSGSGPIGPYCHGCRGESLAIHPDGTAYPCGQTIGDPGMSAGMIDLIDWSRLRMCYQGIELQGNCPTCLLADRCPGDCPSRLRYNNGAGTPVMCTVYRTIAERMVGKSARSNIQ